MYHKSRTAARRSICNTYFSARSDNLPLYYPQIAANWWTLPVERFATRVLQCRAALCFYTTQMCRKMSKASSQAICNTSVFVAQKRHCALVLSAPFAKWPALRVGQFAKRMPACVPASRIGRCNWPMQCVAVTCVRWRAYTHARIQTRGSVAWFDHNACMHFCSLLRKFFDSALCALRLLAFHFMSLHKCHDSYNAAFLLICSTCFVVLNCIAVLYCPHVF